MANLHYQPSWQNQIISTIASTMQLHSFFGNLLSLYIPQMTYMFAKKVTYFMLYSELAELYGLQHCDVF